MKNKLKIFDSIKLGWNSLVKDYPSILGLFIVSGLLTIFLDNVDDSFSRAADMHHNGLLYILSLFVTVLVTFMTAFIGINNLKIVFGYLEGHKIVIRNLFKTVDFKLLLKNVITTFIFGLIALTIFGLFFLPRLLFAQIILVTKNLSILDSFKLSWQITRGSYFEIIGFCLTALLVLIVGLLLLIVGLVPATAIISIASVDLYKKLLAHHHHSHSHVSHN